MCRPSLDEVMMGVAMVISHRSTCLRRNVGCVLVNGRGHIIAVGYNGVASGEPHCNDGHPCAGFDLPAGQDSCEGIHAETNAILQCQNAWDIDTAYVTLSPCKACLKLLLNTSCRRIVFMHEHDDPWSKAQWLKSRGPSSWVHYDK